MIAHLVDQVARALPLPCYWGGYCGEPSALPPAVLTLRTYGKASPGLGVEFWGRPAVLGMWRALGVRMPYFPAARGARPFN